MMLKTKSTLSDIVLLARLNLLMVLSHPERVLPTGDQVSTSLWRTFLILNHQRKVRNMYTQCLLFMKGGEILLEETQLSTPA